MSDAKYVLCGSRRTKHIQTKQPPCSEDTIRVKTRVSLQVPFSDVLIQHQSPTGHVRTLLCDKCVVI